MDGDSGQLTVKRCRRCMKRQYRDRGAGMRSQRQGEAYRKEGSVIRSDDDVGGRARVTRDEERVLRGG